MDVVVTPTGSDSTSWSLKYRLGRPLGGVKRSEDGNSFSIKPELGSSLKGITRAYPTLDEAMTAIAKHLQGECALDGKDWG